MNKVSLRKATIEDAKLLYLWATDPVVREGSFNSDTFSDESHVKWFKKQLNNKNCDIFMCSIDKRLVGQTRLYYEDDKAIINYSICSEERKKGYASLMIKEVMKKVTFGKRKINTFVGEVKPENIASIKVFEKLKFKLEETTKDELVFTKKNVLYIRVDMNDLIATGHLMRCLSLAKEALKYNIETVFITADNEGEKLIKENNFKQIILNSKWNDLNSELPSLVKIIKENNIENLLIDTYSATKEYIEELEKYTKTIYIDDLNTFKYLGSILINYSNYYYKFNYDTSLDTKYLLGTKYALLRNVFNNLPNKKINKEIESILILSGGTDKYNAIDKLLERLSKKNYKIDVICGRYNNNYENLIKKYENDNIEIHSVVTNIEEYMKKVDLAISAGGTTLYELCSIGTPTITYIIADNQIDNVNSFEKEQIMYSLGDIRKDKIDENIDAILEKYNYDFRKKVSSLMQKKVDGKGNRRILEEIFFN